MCWDRQAGRQGYQIGIVETANSPTPFACNSLLWCLYHIVVFIQCSRQTNLPIEGDQNFVQTRRSSARSVGHDSWLHTYLVAKPFFIFLTVYPVLKMCEKHSTRCGQLRESGTKWPHPTAAGSTNQIMLQRILGQWKGCLFCAASHFLHIAAKLTLSCAVFCSFCLSYDMKKVFPHGAFECMLVSLTKL